MQEKRGRKPKEDRKSIKNRPVYLNVSENDENAHGGRKELLKNIHYAIDNPKEIKN